MMSSSSSTTKRLFVSCPHGLEELLSKELSEDLRIEEPRPSRAGVYVTGDLEAIYRINYGSRIASRVLLSLREFRCRDQKDLYKEAQELDWAELIGTDRTFCIDHKVVSHPKLRNSVFAAQVLKDAICDQLRERFDKRPSVDTKNPDVRVNLFILNDRVTISFDTSGNGLHQRGYRRDTGGAPLRENLAAALLKIAKYDGEQSVLDPCCGTGTLLVEAAWMARRIPPGFMRSKWGFEQLPDHDASLWAKVKKEMDSGIRKVNLKFVGIDIEGIFAARGNAEVAGVANMCEWIRGDFRDYHPDDAPKFMITNPPYGKRMNDREDLTPLYRSLGDLIKQQVGKPGRAFVFTGNLPMSKQIGLRSQRRHEVQNGDMECRLVEFDVF